MPMNNKKDRVTEFI